MISKKQGSYNLPAKIIFQYYLLALAAAILAALPAAFLFSR
jgi:hypothetical protein